MHSSLANIVIAVAVAGWIISRQFTARRYGGSGDDARRLFVLPLILVVLGVTQHQLVDPAHQAASVALLVGGVLVEAALACGWAFTTRVWREPDGSVWAKGTPAGLGIWLVMVAVRIGLYALGAAMGVKTGTGSILLALAALILVRGGVVAWRARELEPSATSALPGAVPGTRPSGGRAYGDGRGGHGGYVGFGDEEGFDGFGGQRRPAAGRRTRLRDARGQGLRDRGMRSRRTRGW